MNTPPSIAIEIVCATRAKQRVVRLDVQPGITARQAVEAAGLQHEFPELDMTRLTLGIFGEAVADERILQAGDRVEIYRPLKHEPREARWLQVARGRVR
jgi:putative ubiquitin-RnfH superfamily antitoxin RatB of RatAB toxin-antitoxin module